MKAGSIANQLSEWEKITSDPEILFTVSWLSFDFSEEIDYKGSVISSKFSPEEKMFLSVEIKNLIKESQHEEGEYISPIFLTPTSDGSFRMVLYTLKWKQLNLYLI